MNSRGNTEWERPGTFLGDGQGASAGGKPQPRAAAEGWSWHRKRRKHWYFGQQGELLNVLLPLFNISGLHCHLYAGRDQESENGDYLLEVPRPGARATTFPNQAAWQQQALSCIPGHDLGPGFLQPCTHYQFSLDDTSEPCGVQIMSQARNSPSRLLCLPHCLHFLRKSLFSKG